jgi:NAD(P)-dependent dehydrogenase (short-subunit alcohol dehydrogenase family)
MGIRGYPEPISQPTSTNLIGKTILVTGANTGMGLEAARLYLTLNASRVILAVRTLSKGNKASKYLSTHPSVVATNPSAEIKVMELDLDSYKSVAQFTARVKTEIDALNVVLLNGDVNLMQWHIRPADMRE